MRVWALPCTVLISACAFFTTVRTDDPMKPCPTSNAAPMLDAIMGGALLMTSVVFLVYPCSDGHAGDTCNGVLPIAGAITLIPALLYGGSAVRGFGNTAYCAAH